MYQTLIEKAKKGFKRISFPDNLKNKAVKHIYFWLNNSPFKTYAFHITYLINTEKWEILLDSFYKMIPFGTGGRRGLVGVGPNRINTCTVKISAQGYSEYLIKKFGKIACQRGVILAYDTRESTMEGIPKKITRNVINSLQLAESSAIVYAANGIKTYIFDSARSTPELSFSIKYLEAIGGCIFTASHNPPQYNGEKFYDCNGSQFVPPHDQEILYEINKCENKIQKIKEENVYTNGSIIQVGGKLDKAYYEKVKSVKLGNKREVKILYSPLYGTGVSSVFPILSQLGFDIYLDKKTSTLSGYFENVAFNIPNPEFERSFCGLIESANLCDADIIMNTDSDADRLGLMVKHSGKWIFLDGNQIGIILTKYVLTNVARNEYTGNKPIIIQTWVTTSLINTIAKHNDVDCILDLPTGFKYICNEVDKLFQKGLGDSFLLGIEESNGYLVGSYCGDKDAAGAAVLIAELAASLKEDNVTLVDYINKIYSEYGYCYNYSTEIKFCGVKGTNQIDRIMNYFRVSAIKTIANLSVKKKIDRWDGSPHLSKTDTNARNMITFMIENPCTMHLNKLTIRPSGTETKLKIYIEIFGLPIDSNDIAKVKSKSIDMRKEIEIDFLKKCHHVISTKIPELTEDCFSNVCESAEDKY